MVIIILGIVGAVIAAVALRNAKAMKDGDPSAPVDNIGVDLPPDTTPAPPSSDPRPAPPPPQIVAPPNDNVSMEADPEPPTTDAPRPQPAYGVGDYVKHRRNKWEGTVIEKEWSSPEWNYRVDYGFTKRWELENAIRSAALPASGGGDPPDAEAPTPTPGLPQDPGVARPSARYHVGTIVFVAFGTRKSEVIILERAFGMSGTPDQWSYRVRGVNSGNNIAGVWVAEDRIFIM